MFKPPSVRVPAAVAPNVNPIPAAPLMTPLKVYVPVPHKVIVRVAAPRATAFVKEIEPVPSGTLTASPN